MEFNFRSAPPPGIKFFFCRLPLPLFFRWNSHWNRHFQSINIDNYMWQKCLETVVNYNCFIFQRCFGEDEWKAFYCDLCDTYFSTKAAIVTHLFRHYPTYKVSIAHPLTHNAFLPLCHSPPIPVCDTFFSSKSAIVTHFLNVPFCRKIHDFSPVIKYIISYSSVYSIPLKCIILFLCLPS